MSAYISKQEMKRRQLVNQLELALIQTIPVDQLTVAEIVYALHNVEARMIAMLLKDEWRDKDHTE